MASYNKLLILGNLTADPELKHTPNGICVTAFSVAVARSRKRKDEEQKTDFINAVAWRNTAEFICRYFTKGRSIFLEGELQQRSYADKNGEKRYVWEMVVESAQFVDRQGSGAEVAQFEKTSSDEELPF